MTDEMTMEQMTELVTQKQIEKLTACQDAINDVLAQYECALALSFAKVVVPGLGVIVLDHRAIKWGMRPVFREK